MNFIKTIIISLILTCSFLVLEAQEDNNALNYAKQARELSDSNINQSLVLAQHALRLANIENDSTVLATCWYSLGLAYQSANNYNKAIKAYETAIMFAENSNDYLTLNFVHNNLGVIYRKQESLDLAKSHYASALKYNQLDRDTTSMIYTLTNIGCVCASKTDYIEATEYFSDALILAKTQKETSFQQAYIENNLGYIYYLKEEFSEALPHYTKAKKLFSEINNTQQLHAVYNRIAELNIAILKIDSALYYIQLAESIIGPSSEPSIKQETYYLSYKIHKQLGSGEVALKYFEKSNSILDSIENEELQHFITEMETRYKHDILQNENELQFTKLGKQKLMIWSLTGLTLLIISITLLLILQIIRKNRFTKKLNEQNQIITEQHSTITESVDYAAYILKKAQNTKQIPNKYCTDSFVWLQPRDKVGGDFYRIFTSSNECLLAIADCTGHGVAGGFLSTLSNQFLERSIDYCSISKPLEIIQNMNSLFMSYFENQNTLTLQESLCISLLKFDGTDKLLFAGNKQRVWHLHNNEITEYKGNNQYIGHHLEIESTPQIISVEKGDKIFVFTDGYADQFGEANNKKLKYQNFRNIIKETSLLTAKETKAHLIASHTQWRGNLKQTDDILIAGIII